MDRFRLDPVASGWPLLPPARASGLPTMPSPRPAPRATSSDRFHAPPDCETQLKKFESLGQGFERRAADLLDVSVVPAPDHGRRRPGAATLVACGHFPLLAPHPPSLSGRTRASVPARISVLQVLQRDVRARKPPLRSAEMAPASTRHSEVDTGRRKN